MEVYVRWKELPQENWEKPLFDLVKSLKTNGEMFTVIRDKCWVIIRRKNLRGCKKRFDRIICYAFNDIGAARVDYSFYRGPKTDVAKKRAMLKELRVMKEILEMPREKIESYLIPAALVFQRNRKKHERIIRNMICEVFGSLISNDDYESYIPSISTDLKLTPYSDCSDKQKYIYNNAIQSIWDGTSGNVDIYCPSRWSHDEFQILLADYRRDMRFIRFQKRRWLTLPEPNTNSKSRIYAA